MTAARPEEVRAVHVCKNEFCEHEWEAIMFHEDGEWHCSHNQHCPKCGSEGTTL